MGTSTSSKSIEIVQAILASIREQLSQAKSIAQQAAEAATGEESRAEDKHDTRSTEASYLARGQSLRVAQFESELEYYSAQLASLEKDSGARAPRESVAACTWVRVQNQKQVRDYWVTTMSGGTSYRVGDLEVHTLSLSSPLGDALLGARTGDEVEIDSPQGPRIYRVLSVGS